LPSDVDVRGNFHLSHIQPEEISETMAQTNANLIWKIADLLRGPFSPTSTAM
jgi:hypothetical protein